MTLQGSSGGAEPAPEPFGRAAIAVAGQTLELLAIGTMLVDPAAQVLHRNGVADRILAADDGLTLKQARLSAHRVSDAARLQAAITAATRHEDQIAHHLLVGRGRNRLSYSLAVSALNQGGALFGAPVALVVVIDPELYVPSDRALAECFGLSPAESRLAAALVAGQSLRQIAGTLDLEITTLRTQLASILRKVGVGRQPALVRVLSSIGFLASRSRGVSLDAEKP